MGISLLLLFGPPFSLYVHGMYVELSEISTYINMLRTRGGEFDL